MSRLTKRMFPARERGGVAFNMVVVLAFALYAVVQLSRTTLAAQKIDDHVDSIVVSTPAIAESLTNVPKLDETDVTAQNILAAADGLSAYLDSVIASAGGIDATVVDILSTVQSINGVVLSIGGSVGSIAADVSDIGGTVGTLQPTVRAIQADVALINRNVDELIAEVVPLDADLNQVVGIADRINTNARSIACTGTIPLAAPC